MHTLRVAVYVCHAKTSARSIPNHRRRELRATSRREPQRHEPAREPLRPLHTPYAPNAPAPSSRSWSTDAPQPKPPNRTPAAPPNHSTADSSQHNHHVREPALLRRASALPQVGLDQQARILLQHYRWLRGPRGRLHCPRHQAVLGRGAYCEDPSHIPGSQGREAEADWVR
jgi:hypothetical protein